jgi:hypothetical protein
MSQALLVAVFTSALRTDLTPKELFQLRTEHEASMVVCRQNLARTSDQVVWLVDQIFLPDPQAARLRSMGTEMARFMINLSRMQDLGGQEGQILLDDVRTAIDDIDKSLKRLTATVRSLSRQPPPRRPGLPRRAARRACCLLLAPARWVRRRAERREVEELVAMASTRDDELDHSESDAAVPRTSSPSRW